MFRTFIVLTVCLISTAKTADKRLIEGRPSAATKSQVMFAIENKYDNTGPGATRRETAYKTFNTLEDALINYLSDPDTVLPEYEKSLALRQLARPQNSFSSVRQIPKPAGQYTGYRQSTPTQFNSYRPQHLVPFSDSVNYIDFRHPVKSNVLVKNYYKEQEDQYRLQKYQPVRENPLNLAHYTKDPDVSETLDEFNPNPQYSFSYGVHDKHTGDSKSARETRDGDVVKGYYSFMDADGTQRTVYYTADEKEGFRATVQQTQPNN